MQILAGNARKVSAVRFERINGEEAVSVAKEVTRVVPKIMKRKWNTGDEDPSLHTRSESYLSDDHNEEEETAS